MPTFLSTIVDVTPGTAGSWQDVDLSAHLPGNAAAAIIMMANDSTSYTADGCGARAKGSTDPWISNTFQLFQQIAAVTSEGVLQIYSKTLTSGLAWLIGYFEQGEGVFHPNAIALAVVDSTSQWYNMDISDTVDGGAADGVAVVSYAHYAGARAVIDLASGLSSDTATTSAQNYNIEHHQFVGLADGVFRYYVGSGAVNNCDIDLIGWINEEWTDWRTDRVDRTPAGTSGWQDMTALASGVIGAQYFVEGGAGYYAAGLRAKGASVSHYGAADRLCWCVGKAGTSDIVQAYRTYTSVYFWEQGSFKAYDGTTRDPIFFGMNF